MQADLALVILDSSIFEYSVVGLVLVVKCYLMKATQNVVNTK